MEKAFIGAWIEERRRLGRRKDGPICAETIRRIVEVLRGWLANRRYIEIEQQEGKAGGEKAAT